MIDIFLLNEGGFIQRFIDWIIHNGGLYVLLLIVFAETGLFIGFFFPGDSLLFAAGIWVDDLAKEFFNVHWVVVMLLVIVASILGNMVGYWFGYKTGPLLYERKDSWLFKKKHLVKAKSFYDKYGKPTIFFAKFLPFLRTFAPIVAGMVKMSKPVFMFYNIVGSLCWVSSMMLGGHLLNQWVKSQFGFELKDHIEAITVGIVLVTTLPVLYRIFFVKKNKSETKTLPPDE
ncbi:MAG: DedA family protein [Bacteroidetes bacterium]|nr:DedA family protein [Bacteroidota bacterium]MBS1631446.1 DedA family protein [Bacteroidota bacterium]